MKHRWFVVGLALAAASAFALSVQAGRWWSIDPTGEDLRSAGKSVGGPTPRDSASPIGDVEIGPFGSRSPFGGAGSLSWAGGSARWERFGVATWAGGLVAMFVLVVLAGAVAANRVPRLAAKTALVAIVTAGLAAIGFIAARPDNGLPFAIGRGMMLFAAAVIAGAIAGTSVLRAPSPGHGSGEQPRAAG